MNHLFISYSRREEAIVDAFADRLRKENISIWQDKSGAGTGIPFSTKWFEIIVEAIYMSSGAMVFLSENWKKSNPCGKEIDIIQRCGVPVLYLIPEEVEENPEEQVEKVKAFLAKEVDTPYNNCRTGLCNAAYEYSKGINPYQLVRHTKGISGALLYLHKDIKEFEEVIDQEEYWNKNLEYYSHMRSFLTKAKNIKRRAIAGIAFGILLVALAIVFSVSIIMSIPQGIADSEKMYSGLAQSGSMDEYKKVDPLTAAKMAKDFSTADLSMTAFFTLDMAAVELADTNLPERVMTGSAEGEEKKRMLEQKGIEESKLYTAEIVPETGSLLIKDRNTQKKWTISAPENVSSFAWNEEGTKLVYSAGNKAFVYDPSGIGNPIQLSECFQQIREVKFVKEESGEKVVAETERDSVLIWDDPIPEKEIGRSGIRYGIFTDDSTPTAVFIQGEELVINKGQKETIYTPFPDWKITDNYFAVSGDGGRAALILNKNDEYAVGVVDLTDGTVLCEVTTPVKATSLCYGTDNMIYASAYGCGIMRIDPDAKEVTAGKEQLYYSNIIQWKEILILTDYSGICTLYDRYLTRIDDYGNLHKVFLPYAALAVAEDRGYLYSVNRGAGDGFGCSRFNLETGAVNLFAIKSMDKVDANTAVAVSADEAYVAFGYPNGVVRVYETEHMYLAYEKTFAGESLSAVSFSPDGTMIRALGESGNIYSAEFHHYQENVSLDVMKSNWGQIQEDLGEKMDAYYDAIEN